MISCTDYLQILSYMISYELFATIVSPSVTVNVLLRYELFINLFSKSLRIQCILESCLLLGSSERNAVEDEWVLRSQNKWVQQKMAQLCYFVLQQLLTLNESALSCSRVALFIFFTRSILVLFLYRQSPYFLILLNLMFWIISFAFLFFSEHLFSISTTFHVIRSVI